jgi:hypothetical protein
MNFLRIFILLGTVLIGFNQNANAITSIGDDFYIVVQFTNFSLKDIEIKNQSPLENIEFNYANYKKLYSTFNQFEGFSINFCEKILKKVESGEALSGDDLYYLKNAISTYENINAKMLEFGKLYSLSSGTQIAKSLSSKNQDKTKVLSSLINISAHSSVLKYITNMHNILFNSNNVLRRIVKNTIRLDEDNLDNMITKLKNIDEYVLNMANNRKFSTHIIMIQNIKKDLKKLFEDDEFAQSLILLISTDETIHKLSLADTFWKFNNNSVTDAVVTSANKFMGWLSSVFGNIVGSIKWRKGFFYKNTIPYEKMVGTLKPMDVLLEKSPFSLTDKFIPGHFGHAALYLGTKEQLESINMWDHPDIIPYQEEIINGNTILEAIRTGVHLTSIEEFNNIDEVSIIRKTDVLVNTPLLIESIKRGIDQIGKEYDFNFDVENLDKIVCSELIYLVFGQVHWPSKYRLGRASVTPDNIAEVLFHKHTKFNMEQYIIAPEKNKFVNGSLLDLAPELGYELRAEDGTNIIDINSPLNTFWKKSEKCYNVVKDQQNNINERECKTTYTLEYYEEKTVQN